MGKSRNTSWILWAIAVVVILAAVGVTVYFGFIKKDDKSDVEEAKPSTPVATSPSGPEPTTTRVIDFGNSVSPSDSAESTTSPGQTSSSDGTYHNAKFGFSISYPPEGSTVEEGQDGNSVYIFGPFGEKIMAYGSNDTGSEAAIFNEIEKELHAEDWTILESKVTEGVVYVDAASPVGIRQLHKIYVGSASVNGVYVEYQIGQYEVLWPKQVVDSFTPGDLEQAH